MFPLIFLLVTSHFSLSFDFSPLSFLLLFFFLNISEDYNDDVEEF